MTNNNAFELLKAKLAPKENGSLSARLGSRFDLKCRLQWVASQHDADDPHETAKDEPEAHIPQKLVFVHVDILLKYIG